MLVKNLHQHSPPKFHDVGEDNVGEKGSMLAKKDLLIQNDMYIGELCW